MPDCKIWINCHLSRKSSALDIFYSVHKGIPSRTEGHWILVENTVQEVQSMGCPVPASDNNRK